MPNRTWILAFLIILLAGFSSATAAQLRIESSHNVYPASAEELSIYFDSLAAPLAGFSLTIALNETVYSILDVQPGAFVTDCGWEYFTWHTADTTIPVEPLSRVPQTGLLHIEAFASATSGYVPTCLTGVSPLELTKLMLLTASPKPWTPLECEFVPISFFWRDCGDNVLFSTSTDTIYCAAQLRFTPDGDTITAPFPGYGVPGSNCLTDTVPIHLPTFTAVDGGLDFICAGLSYRGDLNLNGFPYEAADAVLFTNYFIHGLAVFTINVTGQIAATDVNCDGQVLTLPDLVYLLRVITGDILPCPGQVFKPSPRQTSSARLWVADDGTLWIDADSPIRALAVRMVGADNLNSDFPSATFGRIGDSMTCLVISPDGSLVLETGSHTIARAARGSRIICAEAVDQNGDVMKIDLGGGLLPMQLTLAQNYPNPFNPTTTITFALPVASDWTLTVTNITGQQIAVRAGFAQAGTTTLTIDASTWASGLYLYTLTAGSSSSSRKMTLLK